MPNATLAGIYYLRQLADAKQIQHAVCTATNAVVIGGGFIGMEVAAVLQRQAIATTLVFPDAHVWGKLFTTRIANFFEKYYQQQGVTISGQSKVIGFCSEAGCVTHVSLATALGLPPGPNIPADLVVAGIGVTPMWNFLPRVTLCWMMVSSSIIF